MHVEEDFIYPVKGKCFSPDSAFQGFILFYFFRKGCWNGSCILERLLPSVTRKMDWQRQA